MEVKVWIFPEHDRLPCGDVVISRTASLHQLREVISQELPHFPSNYRFLAQGYPVPIPKESNPLQSLEACGIGQDKREVEVFVRVLDTEDGRCFPSRPEVQVGMMVSRLGSVDREVNDIRKTFEAELRSAKEALTAEQTLRRGLEDRVNQLEGLISTLMQQNVPLRHPITSQTSVVPQFTEQPPPPHQNGRGENDLPEVSSLTHAAHVPVCAVSNNKAETSDEFPTSSLEPPSTTSAPQPTTTEKSPKRPPQVPPLRIDKISAPETASEEPLYVAVGTTPPESNESRSSVVAPTESVTEAVGAVAEQVDRHSPQPDTEQRSEQTASENRSVGIGNSHGQTLSKFHPSSNDDHSKDDDRVLRPLGRIEDQYDGSDAGTAPFLQRTIGHLSQSQRDTNSHSNTQQSPPAVGSDVQVGGQRGQPVHHHSTPSPLGIRHLTSNRPQSVPPRSRRDEGLEEALRFLSPQSNRNLSQIRTLLHKASSRLSREREDKDETGAEHVRELAGSVAADNGRRREGVPRLKERPTALLVERSEVSPLPLDERPSVLAERVNQRHRLERSLDSLGRRLSPFHGGARLGDGQGRVWDDQHQRDIGGYPRGSSASPNSWMEDAGVEVVQRELGFADGEEFTLLTKGRSEFRPRKSPPRGDRAHVHPHSDRAHVHPHSDRAHVHPHSDRAHPHSDRAHPHSDSRVSTPPNGPTKEPRNAYGISPLSSPLLGERSGTGTGKGDANLGSSSKWSFRYSRPKDYKARITTPPPLEHESTLTASPSALPRPSALSPTPSLYRPYQLRPDTSPLPQAIPPHTSPHSSSLPHTESIVLADEAATSSTVVTAPLSRMGSKSPQRSVRFSIPPTPASSTHHQSHFAHSRGVSPMLPPRRRRNRSPTVISEANVHRLMETNEFVDENRRNRCIRLYLTSTLLDLTAERELLHRITFPALRQRCASRGVMLSVMDMRMGLTSEEGESVLSVRRCLEEIDRCRPYLVAVVGERYGWHIRDGLSIGMDSELLRIGMDEAVRQFPWVAQHRNKSLSELEILHMGGLGDHSALAEAENEQHRFKVYVRSESYREMLPETSGNMFRVENTDAQRLMSALRQRLERTRAHIERYNHPREVADMVLSDVWTDIQRDFPCEVYPSKLETMWVSQEALRRSRCQLYYGLKENADRLTQHVLSKIRTPLLVHGDEGVGKSALVSNWVEEQRGHPSVVDVDFVIHSIGSSNGESEAGALVDTVSKLLQCLRPTATPRPSAASLRDMGRLSREQLSAYSLQVHLAQAAAKRRVALIIDGVDCLQPSAQTLDWVQSPTPPGVSLILTCRSNTRAHSAAKVKEWSLFHLKGLRSRDKQHVLHLYTDRKEASKLEEEVLRHNLSSNPLFLSLAAKEPNLVCHAKFETISDLWLVLLRQWEAEVNRTSMPTLLQDCMCAIRCSKFGLSEHEIMEGLSVPPHQWATVNSCIKGAIVIRRGLITFYHRSVGAAVDRKYLVESDQRISYHEKLSMYFQEANDKVREMEELPWHLHQSEAWAALRHYLGDLSVFQLFVQTEDGTNELRRAWKTLGLQPSNAKSGADAGHVYLRSLDAELKRMLSDLDDESETVDTQLGELVIVMVEVGVFLYRHMRDPISAIKSFGEAVTLMEALTEDPTELFAITCIHLSYCYIDKYHISASESRERLLDKAVTFATQSVECRKVEDSPSTDLIEALLCLGRALYLQGKLVEAKIALVECMRCIDGLAHEDQCQLAITDAIFLLGDVMMRQEDTRLALELYQQGCEIELEWRSELNPRLRFREMARCHAKLGNSEMETTFTEKAVALQRLLSGTLRGYDELQ